MDIRPPTEYNVPVDCFVSGCFDLLHSGHIAFLQRAATFGRLHVAIGSDATVTALKGRPPICSQLERMFMLRALKCVHATFVATGTGQLDFEHELRTIRPDIFVVNEDGHSSEKEGLCQNLGIEYRRLNRIPYPGLPRRSTTELRRARAVPYRIDLAGGWLDQPYISRVAPGPVITASLEPTEEFSERSGLATSTRRVALDIWDSLLAGRDYEAAAKILFAVENPPGKSAISGSQDSIGIVFPGVAMSVYAGGFWPDLIVHKSDARIVQFINNHVRLIGLGPRDESFDVLAEKRISKPLVSSLSEAARNCWSALIDCNLERFGAAVRASFESQIKIFPRMQTASCRQAIQKFSQSSYGWKLCGAGGGGYLMLVTDQEVSGSVRISVRS